MIRPFLRAVLHNLTVTQADAAWPVSIRIDPLLLRAAEILPLEQVQVVNVATGDRFTTFAEPAAEGSGEVRVHSGMRHPVRAGDTISVVSFGDLHDGQTLTHAAKIVTVDARNGLVSLTEGRPGA